MTKNTFTVFTLMESVGLDCSCWESQVPLVLGAKRKDQAIIVAGAKNKNSSSKLKYKNPYVAALKTDPCRLNFQSRSKRPHVAVTASGVSDHHVAVSRNLCYLTDRHELTLVTSNSCLFKGCEPWM